MRQFPLSSLDGVVAMLAAVRPDMILYGCTSATLAHGVEFDRKFAQQISDMTSGKPTITAAGALVAALKALDVRKIAFSSPYTEQLNQESIGFLKDCGFETVSSAYVGEELGIYGASNLTPEQVVELGISADSDSAEAIVLSCTDMCAVEAIDELERTLGKPVITSNQALMFAAAKALNLTRDEVVCAGRLFRHL